MLAHALLTILLSAGAIGNPAATPPPPSAVESIDAAAPAALGASTSGRWAAETHGGFRQPHSLKGCALALGTAIGALFTTGAIPMVGSLVASMALHAALFACF